MPWLWVPQVWPRSSLQGNSYPRRLEIWPPRTTYSLSLPRSRFQRHTFSWGEPLRLPKWHTHSWPGPPCSSGQFEGATSVSELVGWAENSAGSESQAPSSATSTPSQEQLQVEPAEFGTLKYLSTSLTLTESNSSDLAYHSSSGTQSSPLPLSAKAQPLHPQHSCFFCINAAPNPAWINTLNTSSLWDFCLPSSAWMAGRLP